MRTSVLVALVFGATSVGVAQSNEAAAEAASAFALGSEAFAAERYEEALEQFRRAYILAPHDAVRGSVGRSLERLGQFEEALVEYEAVARSDDVPPAERAHARELATRVRARMEALAPAEVQPAAEPEPELEHPIEIPDIEAEPSRRPLWLTATGSAVALATASAAIGLGVYGSKIEEDYNAMPTVNLLDRGRRFQRVTNTMIGVAISAAVAVVVDLIVRLAR